MQLIKKTKEISHKSGALETFGVYIFFICALLFFLCLSSGPAFSFEIFSVVKRNNLAPSTATGKKKPDALLFRKYILFKESLSMSEYAHLFSKPDQINKCAKILAGLSTERQIGYDYNSNVFRLFMVLYGDHFDGRKKTFEGIDTVLTAEAKDPVKFLESVNLFFKTGLKHTSLITELKRSDKDPPVLGIYRLINHLNTLTFKSGKTSKSIFGKINSLSKDPLELSKWINNFWNTLEQVVLKNSLKNQVMLNELDDFKTDNKAVKHESIKIELINYSKIIYDALLNESFNTLAFSNRKASFLKLHKIIQPFMNYGKDDFTKWLAGNEKIFIELWNKDILPILLDLNLNESLKEIIKIIESASAQEFNSIEFSPKPWLIKDPDGNSVNDFSGLLYDFEDKPRKLSLMFISSSSKIKPLLEKSSPDYPRISLYFNMFKSSVEKYMALIEILEKIINWEKITEEECINIPEKESKPEFLAYLLLRLQELEKRDVIKKQSTVKSSS